MVKSQKRDHVANPKHNHQSSDGSSNAITQTNPTPRTLRSNAAVCQMIASTTSTNTPSNISSTFNVTDMPYSSARSSSQTRLNSNIDFNRSKRTGMDPIMASVLSGASLLSQDFFLKGMDCSGDEPNFAGDGFDLTQSALDQTNEMRHEIPNDIVDNRIDLPQDNGNFTSSSITTNPPSNYGRHEIAFDDAQTNGNHVSEETVQSPCDTTSTRDLIEDLRSLIFHEGERPIHNSADKTTPDLKYSLNQEDGANGSISEAVRATNTISSDTIDNRLPTDLEFSSNSPLDKTYSPATVTKPDINSEISTSAMISDPVPGPSNIQTLITQVEPINSDIQRVINASSRRTQKSSDKKNNSKSNRKSKRSIHNDKRFATISKLPSIPSSEFAQSNIQDINKDLPPNWEARLDAHGRVFYLDHERRITTWHRPPSRLNVGNSVLKIKVPQSRITDIAIGENPNVSESTQVTNNDDSSETRIVDPTEQQRALLNRRYTLRRTISTKRTSRGDIEQHHDISSSGIDSSAPNIKSGLDLNNSDTIDGNCMSSSQSNQARSYNLCVNQGIPGALTHEPVPGTSRDDPVSSAHCEPSTSTNSRAEVIGTQRSPQIACPPALKFLNRSDFYSILHLSDEALRLFNQSKNLKYIIGKVRKDKTNSDYARFQHNKDLVALLNLFALENDPLPPGWAIKNDEHGKRFFIDHNRRATTYVDPRLPTEVPLFNPLMNPLHGTRALARSSNENSAGDNRTSTSMSDPSIRGTIGDIPLSRGDANSAPTVSYEEKIVAFLKQPNILDLIREKRLGPSFVNTSMREKINQIRKGGVNILKKYSYDVNLMLVISLFDNEIDAISTTHLRPTQIPPQSRTSVSRIFGPGKTDFEAKLRQFYRKLEQKNFGQGPNKLKLGVRRDHILEDAFTKVMSVNAKKDLQKSRLYVSFAGEEGLDYGGPSREFFFLLSRELFNPYYGLFEYSANDTYTVQISPMSRFVDNYHDWFRFSGRMLGLALIHQYLLDAFFTRPFYKALLGLDCSLSDLEYLDAEFHQSLLWVKDNDISDLDLDLTFSVVEEVAGKVIEKDLKPNGKSVVVTERNKREYIEKMVKWRLERGVSEQTDSLIKGFYEVIDPRIVRMFDARELELVIAGTAEIDVKDWRRHTDYRGGYHDSHLIIQWFWIVIEQKFDNDQRLRLLQFVTGTSSIPYEGFEALRGSNGPRKFCIEKWGKPTSLPRAHTCFNRLDLPPYSSFEILYEKLLLAVEESSSFGIE